MPLTRSGASGKKNVEVNKTEVKNETKKIKGKAAKREADQKVDDPPKKTNKKETQNTNGIKKKLTKKELATEKATEEEVEESEAPMEANDALEQAENIYEFKANDIKGNEVSLDKYKGHVCIIVNVASKCGHTKAHYEQLVEIFDKYSEEKGLRILAFPCNQFGKQEPGDSAKICEFVEKRNVKFDMFEKIDVNGKNAHPLWKFLTEEIEGPKGKRIPWNFSKFIINKEGKVVERHEAAKKPLQLVENLEKYW